MLLAKHRTPYYHSANWLNMKVSLIRTELIYITKK